MKKSVCLFSGGLDSTTLLYWALKQPYEVIALTTYYGQKHEREISCAQKIARDLKLQHYIVPLTMPWGGSALVDDAIPIPQNRSDEDMGKEIPATYVPARNTIFLSLAASCAESLKADFILIGANAIDYSGYPDCRPEYFQSFSDTLRLGTKTGVRGMPIEILAPFVRMTKKAIIEIGASLGVPYEKTWSCYFGKKEPCLRCDSCLLRAKGFKEAGLKDPLIHYEVSSNR